MTQPTALAHKGEVVEEWTDLHFFRPLGMRLVGLLAPTRVSADQVTVAALVIGLAAGHLFYYRSPALNALGLLLFVLSDILDSADGQLARLRGNTTRMGRVLDGISDNLRFVNLYAHLIARLLATHAMAPLAAHTMAPLAVALLALVAGYSHSLQAGIADYLRQIYLYVAEGSGELDLPEDLPAAQGSSWLGRLGLSVYASYVTRQAAWCSGSVAVVRAIRKGAAWERLSGEWRERQAAPVRRCALIAQNVRFLLLAVTALVGWPAGFLWLTAIPLNLALAWVLISHERTAAQLSRTGFAAPDLVVAESL